jgi:hypothetical protein
MAKGRDLRLEPEAVDWAVVRSRYTAWLCVPLSDRLPTTEAQLASDLGVGLEDLRRVRRDPAFMAQLGEAMRLALIDLIPVFTGKYMEGARDANPAQILKFLEQLGITGGDDTTPKIIVGIDPENL